MTTLKVICFVLFIGIVIGCNAEKPHQLGQVEVKRYFDKESKYLDQPNKYFDKESK